MLFSIDPNNGVPIYEQIVRQVKFAVAEKLLTPGQLIPSVRALSQQLTINPNTINRAFLQLQSDGVVESLRGKGQVVCAGAYELCVAARREVVADRFRNAISEALHSGLSQREIRSIVSEQLTALVGAIDSVSTQVPDEPSS